MQKVTIITPSYNRAHLLPATIESVLAQTFTNFEYLILDDGSQDNTEEVVRPYLNDTRVRYLYHENIGEAETANKGWSLSNCEYFTQVNSDDPVYPNFLEVMVGALDAQPDKILAYPDFDFINEYGKIIQTTKGNHWNFLKNLAQYNCEAACPGTVLRRSALTHLARLKRKGYKYINDVEMYWNLALHGDFLHIPHVLATWRVHAGQISSVRYQSIPECEDWYNKYFSNPNLPQEILAIKPKVRESLDQYYSDLICNAAISLSKKKEIKNKFRDEYGINFEKFTCIQLGDTDIIGNKFNGHDLQVALNQRNIRTYHFVCNKKSHDKNTFTCTNDTSITIFENIVQNKYFAEADIIHLHLMHNTNFDIQHIPFISSLKPVVWTLHDPWSLGGHCIHHHGCTKWMSHCGDCPHLDIPFELKSDSSALNFAIKKFAISQASITVIVASHWMKNKVEQSPIWKNKKIFLIPFGIDQHIFRPRSKREACLELGIPPENFVIFARTQRHFKGLHILEKTLKRLKITTPVTLLTVGENHLLKNLPSTMMHKEFGWINDDKKLATLYQASDIFLMPSEQETFGMMAIEAMSCGKVVLALEGTSLPDVINAPQCGLAAAEDAYPQLLQNLYDSPEEIIERGMLSYKFAIKEYNKDTYIDRITDAYTYSIKNFIMDKDTQYILDQIHTHSLPPNGINQMQPDDCINKYSTLLCRLKNYHTTYGTVKTIRKIVEKVSDLRRKI